MKIHKYTLQKYKTRSSRFDCPECNKKNTFTRYIDNETEQYVNEKVGRCNREQKCGYHYKPKEYFNDNQIKGTKLFIDVERKPEPPISYLSKELINTNYKNTELHKYLGTKFEIGEVNRIMELYRIGGSQKWNGSTVFYQFDKLNNCRTGKVMLYSGNTGKRIKKPYNHIAWIHSNIDNYNLQQCLFGEHLIKPSDNTPIAIVESEKTALIMAIVQPQFIWLATGGLSNLSKNKITGLGFRKVVIFPDSGCTDTWSKKIKGINNITVSSALESYPIGYDLADLIG